MTLMEQTKLNDLFPPASLNTLHRNQHIIQSNPHAHNTSSYTHPPSKVEDIDRHIWGGQHIIPTAPQKIDLPPTHLSLPSISHTLILPPQELKSLTFSHASPLIIPLLNTSSKVIYPSQINSTTHPPQEKKPSTEGPGRASLGQRALTTYPVECVV